MNKDFRVVFVNWTKPYFYKKQAEGYNFDKLADLTSEDYDMVDYELRIQQAAIDSVRKYMPGNRIYLYTDTAGYNFYKQKGMLQDFDFVNIEVLDNYNKTATNPGKWWTSGKSVVMGHVTTPFLFLDNDFILQSAIPDEFWDYDLIHTQWEIQRGHFYVTQDMFDKLEVPIDNFEEKMLMPNTSFVWMNNDTIKNSYYENHLKIVNKEYESIPEWLWLLSDQGLLGYCAREHLNAKVGTLEKNAYLSYAEHPKKEDECGYTPMWVDINNKDHFDHIKYRHIWIDKRRMKNDIQFRRKVLSEIELREKKDLL